VCKQNSVFNVYLLVYQTVVLFAGTFHIITITKHLHVWRFRCPNCPSTCFGMQLAAFRNKMIQDQHKTGVHDDAIAHEVEALRYKLEGRGFDFQWSQCECFIALILPAALWSWDRLCLQQKWVPGIFSGWQRQPVRRADNLATFMCRLSRNSGSLNLLEP
jgi:hypothetical protein